MGNPLRMGEGIGSGIVGIFLGRQDSASVLAGGDDARKPRGDAGMPRPCRGPMLRPPICRTMETV